jgi:hypothetical protein
MACSGIALPFFTPSYIDTDIYFIHYTARLVGEKAVAAVNAACQESLFARDLGNACQTRPIGFRRHFSCPKDTHCHRSLQIIKHGYSASQSAVWLTRRCLYHPSVQWATTVSDAVMSRSTTGSQCAGRDCWSLWRRRGWRTAKSVFLCFNTNLKFHMKHWAFTNEALGTEPWR